MCINFVGDRGYCVNSRIKGFRKYGGKWKPTRHSRYCPTIITNEYNSSQTCVYCFAKTTHPAKAVTTKKGVLLKSVNGTSVCSNPQCILSKVAATHQPRDRMSALAIGLAGLSRIALGVTMPPFQSFGPFNTEFHNIATAFLKRSAEGLQLDELDT
jgi:hypothetical protein